MTAASPLRLACVTAHPDDESLGFGGTLARYAAEGVEVSVVSATRGERGRYFDGSEPHPGPEEMGRIREDELRAAATELGVRHVRFLDYVDGALDRADTAESLDRMARAIRALRPHVVVTFDPYGVYGHPDHIAISQLVLAGIVRAASPEALEGAGEPHQVSKLYYHAWTEPSRANYAKVFKSLTMNVDGEVRPTVTWPAWSVTTRADAHDHWEAVWRAVRCHRTQLGQYGSLAELTPEEHRELWGPQEYYRAFSLVNFGRAPETDLFEGLR